MVLISMVVHAHNRWGLAYGRWGLANLGTGLLVSNPPPKMRKVSNPPPKRQARVVTQICHYLASVWYLLAW